MNHVSPRNARVTGRPGVRRVDILRARMAENPDRIGIRLRLASVLSQQGLADEAEAVLRQTVAQAPENRRAATELQAFLIGAGRPVEPASDAEEAVQLAAPAAEAAPARETSQAPDATVPDLPELFAMLRASQAELAGPGQGRQSRLERRRTWRPPVELIVSVSIVTCVGLLGLASRRINHSLVLPPSDISLLQAESGAPTSLPAALDTVVLAPAVLGSTQRIDVATLTPTMPEMVVAAPSPPHPLVADLPEAAPLDVTISYPDRDPVAVAQAQDLAARLRRHGTAVRVAGQPAVRSAEAGVGYYFQEDEAGARSIAEQLGGGIGPVRHLVRPGGAQPPGAIAVTLRPSIIHPSTRRED